MLDAITAVNEAAPGTLESHPRVKFQLQCQHFVEMVGYCCVLGRPFLRNAWFLLVNSSGSSPLTHEVAAWHLFSMQGAPGHHAICQKPKYRGDATYHGTLCMLW